MFANICCKSHKVRPYFGSYVRKNVNKNLNKTQTITRIHFVTFITSVPLLMRIRDVILEPLHLFYRGFGTQTKTILLLWYRLWAAWRPNLVFWPTYEACLKQPRSERRHSSLGVFSCPCPCPCPFFVFLASGSWSPSSLFLLPHLLTRSPCSRLEQFLIRGGCWYAIHALVFGRSKVLIFCEHVPFLHGGGSAMSYGVVSFKAYQPEPFCFSVARLKGSKENLKLSCLDLVTSLDLWRCTLILFDLYYH